MRRLIRYYLMLYILLFPLGVFIAMLTCIGMAIRQHNPFMAISAIIFGCVFNYVYGLLFMVKRLC